MIDIFYGWIANKTNKTHLDKKLTTYSKPGNNSSFNSPLTNLKKTNKNKDAAPAGQVYMIS